ncbi:DeoR family transcriptional regulator [Thermocrinis minervae]|uniref:DNA-binding transcriptional regulator of sugar metabolism, DeoR/GlpR family n=1 Tax=Thermocrinis minervae TaxID=381751 RepID=A0A1M6T4J7_9AQUI|nr:DeoR family transcriptional regulator [Thermocrinis minervae]SHK51816.1 DNA-binding transcriptional regulator of sugar metabolism, DeoR/GlpR family [Thermocrinis minervae]
MDRKEEILKLIGEGYRTVKALAQHFGVSLMTIYRDVRELEREGRIVRRHGELLLKDEVETKEELHRCSYCSKLVDERLEFVYILEGNRKVKACCAHCGLLLYKSINKEKIESCMTYDFITGNPINCFSAWFVVGSAALPCCTPSAIAFARKEDAEKFAKGFGGEVLDFSKAVETIERLMKLGTPVTFNL